MTWMKRPWTRADETRKRLRYAIVRNRIEIDTGKKAYTKVRCRLRERLVAENFAASDEEIDAKVNRIMLHGMRPTREASSGIPKEVLDEHRRARRAEVKKGRHRRRGE